MSEKIFDVDGFRTPEEIFFISKSAKDMCMQRSMPFSQLPKFADKMVLEALKYEYSWYKANVFYLFTSAKESLSGFNNFTNPEHFLKYSEFNGLVGSVGEDNLVSWGSSNYKHDLIHRDCVLDCHYELKKGKVKIDRFEFLLLIAYCISKGWVFNAALEDFILTQCKDPKIFAIENDKHKNPKIQLNGTIPNMSSKGFFSVSVDKLCREDLYVLGGLRNLGIWIDVYSYPWDVDQMLNLCGIWQVDPINKRKIRFSSNPYVTEMESGPVYFTRSYANEMFRNFGLSPASDLTWKQDEPAACRLEINITDLPNNQMSIEYVALPDEQPAFVETVEEEEKRLAPSQDSINSQATTDTLFLTTSWVLILAAILILVKQFGIFNKLGDLLFDENKPDSLKSKLGFWMKNFGTFKHKKHKCLVKGKMNVNGFKKTVWFNQNYVMALFTQYGFVHELNQTGATATDASTIIDYDIYDVPEFKLRGFETGKWWIYEIDDFDDPTILKCVNDLGIRKDFILLREEREIRGVYGVG